MNAFEQLYHFPMFRAPLLAGIAVGTACSLLSVIVVLKRMAFVGEGVAHAGYGGVGTAVFLGLLGWRQDAVILAFCLATGMMIGLLSRRRHIEPDSAIGILLVGAMAWGVLMGDLRRVLLDNPWYVQTFLGGQPQAPPNADQLLFGSLMTVDWTNAWSAVIVCAAVLLICAALAKELLFFIFDEPASRVFGVPATALHYLLLALLALTIVVGVRLVGFILVGALLVIPGATAALLTRRLGVTLLLAWLVGMIGTVGGILLSLQAGRLSTGACIVAVLCLLFGLAMAATAPRRRRREQAAA